MGFDAPHLRLPLLASSFRLLFGPLASAGGLLVKVSGFAGDLKRPLKGRYRRTSQDAMKVIFPLHHSPRRPSTGHLVYCCFLSGI